MNTTKYFSILMFACMLGSCEVNQSVNKDLKTGASSRGDGIGCDDVVMEINGNVENRNVFTDGERIKLIFNNVKGLKQIGGKFFPGLSITIFDNRKDKVSHNADLLTELNEGTDLKTLQLQAEFLANLPFKNQEKYTVFVKIWDKKGTGTFTYELPFKIKENKLLDISSEGLNYKNIYLWNQTSRFSVAESDVSIEDELILILDSLSGLNEVDGKVYPALSIEITDRNGNQILMNPNILEEMTASGVSSVDLENSQIPVTLSFTAGKINNPCHLKAVFTDENSDKRIDVSTELNLH